MTAVVHTIGHSNRTLESFLDLLLSHGVTAVADVRSQPYSRVNPQFKKEALSKVLASRRIAYVFLGEELGARTRDADCYVDGKVQYDRLARTEAFQRGLSRVEKGTQEHQVALMCAEKDPLVCHRSILIARHLVRRGAFVKHIIDMDVTEDHDVSIARLLSTLRMDSLDMFTNADDLVELAYERQAAKIAFVRDGEEETQRRESA